MSLKGKNILLGITGSIAAYKAATLVRLLVKEGANVKVVMTPLAKEFITPLTMATLCKNPILVDFFNPENGDWNSHVSLGLWADMYLIAPATANTIGKMANGIADNLLLTTYLSSKCPVVVAPAMDLDMYKHTATQDNIETLRKNGVYIVEPESGELASGLEGKGRMEEPEIIVKHVRKLFAKKDLLGFNVLITAGPTYEKIDPVRFIGNYSTGKMGYALAEEFSESGAKVTIVSGPVSIEKKLPDINIINVHSAAEMYDAVESIYTDFNAVVLCAAVADFSPVEQSDVKLKRGKDDLVLKLQPTKDIASMVGANKKEGQIVIGFALETTDEENNAYDKMMRKNLDFIVLNSLNDEGAGFGGDTNKVTILDRNGDKEYYDVKSKQDVAEDIINKVVDFVK